MGCHRSDPDSDLLECRTGAPEQPSLPVRFRNESESLRFVVCLRSGCERVFFICRYCDHGRRYCGAECANAARRASLGAAGRRYQATPQGRERHAQRQRRYRERRREQLVVTHHGPAGRPLAVSERAGLAMRIHLRVSGEGSGDCLACRRCGRAGRFLRHATLTFTGRPECQRRFRSRAHPARARRNIQAD